ncbi:MAG: diguanylate cyclase [Legionella sp.]|uniref:diguanylate cyclase n=1 Tax=Legionella sp. TaxID=459 RepID=UPI0039E6891D
MMVKKIRPIKLSKSVLNTIFILALLLFSIMSISSYKELRNLVGANEWVTHTYEVIRKMDTALFSLSEIESKQRSYLVTGDKNYLANINIIKPQINKAIKESYALTTDNIRQQERLNEFSKLIDDRLALLNQIIALKDADKFNTPEGEKLFNHSEEASNQIKDLGKEIKAVEEVLLYDRTIDTLHQAYISRMFLIWGGIVSLTFLVIPFLLANFELINRELIEHKIRNTRTHLRQIIESTTDMIAAFDDKNHLIVFNEAYHLEFKKLFGKSLIIGMNKKDVFSPLLTAKNHWLEIWKDSLRPEEEVKIMNYEEGKTIYELRSILVKNEHNEIKGLVHNVRDITNKVKEHSALQESNEKLSEGLKELQLKNKQITLLVDMSDILLAASSQDELSKVMAKYAKQLLHFSSGYLYIMHPSKNYLEKAIDWGNPENQEEIFTPEQCWGIRLGRVHEISEQRKELICEHIKEDIQKTSTLICVPLMAQNDIYGLLYLEIHNPSFKFSNEEYLIITAFTELTALALANVRLRENLRYQSIRDPLTGLYNRRYLEDALFKQIHQAERDHFSFAILMLDLDHFKKINDTHGHDAGDAVLKAVSEMLDSAIRQGDVASRYGGEEFVLMLHNIDMENAKNRAKSICSNVTKLQLKYGAQQVGPMSVSIGIAIYPNDSKDQEELIEQADKALYIAKKSGRNCVVLYSEVKEANQF